MNLGRVADHRGFEKKMNNKRKAMYQFWALGYWAIGNTGTSKLLIGTKGHWTPPFQPPLDE